MCIAYCILPISYDLNFIINNLSFKISDEQKNIYKNVKFYSPGELNNHWHKIKLFSNDFNANKILVYQDIWIFEKFDIASINVDKYLWLPIHNDFREHKLLGFKDNFNSEINNHETFHKILDIYNNNTNNFDLTFNFKSSGMAKILKKNDENLFVSKKIIIRQFTFKNLILL